MGKIKNSLRVAAYTVALPLLSEISGCTQSMVDLEVRATEKICRDKYESYYDNYRNIQKTSGRFGVGGMLGLLGLTFGLIDVNDRKGERK